MNSPLAQCLVGAVLVLVGMSLALGLVRLAANAFIVVVAVAAVFFTGHAILSGEWMAWGQIVPRSLGVGVLAALVCLPALPFSSFRRRK